MSSHARIRPAVLSVGRVLVLLAALAGLFAMHGLSDHGMAGPSDVAGVVNVHAVHGSMAMPVHGAAVIKKTTDQEPQPLGEHDVAMGGVCLAVLIVVLLLGLALWRRMRASVASWSPHKFAGMVSSAREAVPRPPNLFALSIQRS
jgi:hypothetical protein